MIKIEDLLPLIKQGYVAMDFTGKWYHYKEKPQLRIYVSGENFAGMWDSDVSCNRLPDNIAPYLGDWKDSLMECGK